MERLPVIQDNKLFDKTLKSGLPEGGDLEILIKDKATGSGAPLAMVAFTVQLPDGTLAKAQAVTTLPALIGALQILEARYRHVS